jgi:hypothetical protein
MIVQLELLQSHVEAAKLRLVKHRAPSFFTQCNVFDIFSGAS